MRFPVLPSSCRLLLPCALALAALLLGCGEKKPPEATCPTLYEFTPGTDGHADPLGVAAGQARAGRVTADELPTLDTGMAVWEPGDFVLLNEKVALLIEDVGPSDLYDPWGGRPVGMARVEGGALVDAADFGEMFILTGRTTVLTESVTVIDDGSDGSAAIVRAAGRLSPVPFFEAITGTLLPASFSAFDAAIEYVLEPGADYVDIYMVYQEDQTGASATAPGFYGFMYTKRMPLWAPGLGFEVLSGGIGGGGPPIPYAAFVDDAGVSWAFLAPSGELSPIVDVSGFIGMFGASFSIPGCAETRRHHARVTIGGRGLDGLLSAIRRTDGTAERTISGFVYDSMDAPVEGARVHALDADGGHLTRSALTGVDGSYALHVDANREVTLVGYRQGDALTAEVVVPVGTATADLTLPPGGWVDVTVTDPDLASGLPVRIQVLPSTGFAPTPPGRWGEYYEASNRIHVAYPTDGHALLRVPAGDVRVIASRGFEYDVAIADPVTVGEDATVAVPLSIQRVVDTAGVMCGDFHIHSHRSNDSDDLGTRKVLSAIADGVEIPVRSEHEYVEDFDPIVQQLGLTPWAFGMASIELTTMELFGHFGVVPLEPDPVAINGGAIPWQRFPTADDPTIPLENLTPPELFTAVRARPEQPALIINHPRGGANYFTEAEYDPVTGTVGQPALWDELFDLVEVFNDSGWDANRNGTVADWLSLLDSGRQVFAVGSSDSHGVRTSPVGYPRTCMSFPDAVDGVTGDDDPRLLTPDMVRDQLRAGRSTISGGIYLTVDVNGAGPGETATGLGPAATLNVTVQAAPWVDVDDLVIVVDGLELGPPIDINSTTGTWGNPGDGITRLTGSIPDIPVAATGSYVIVVARGSDDLLIHPGRVPFAVSNPIFLSQ